MIQYFILKLHFGGLHFTSHHLPKFELPMAQGGMVYKISDSVYKIVQNKYKIMIYFSFSKSVLVGPVTCTLPGTPPWTWYEGLLSTAPKPYMV